MKVEIHIDPACGEPAVTITAPRHDRGGARPGRPAGGGRGPHRLGGGPRRPPGGGRPAPLLREEKGVRAQTIGGVYDLKERLYELEARLDRHAFVRISHSEIVNLRKITALDLSLTGTNRITLTGGTVCWASRRYVKKIKEALGL